MVVHVQSVCTEPRGRDCHQNSRQSRGILCRSGISERILAPTLTVTPRSYMSTYGANRLVSVAHGSVSIERVEETLSANQRDWANGVFIDPAIELRIRRTRSRQDVLRGRQNVLARSYENTVDGCLLVMSSDFQESKRASWRSTETARFRLVNRAITQKAVLFSGK